MNRNRKFILGAAVIVAVLAAGTSAAVASGSASEEAPISGSALASASAAALQHTAGGRVTDTEVGDEQALYEVEVTLPNGSEVDVHLDKDFKYVAVPSDSDDPAGKR